MVSGQGGFAGQSAADRASAILKEDPPELRATGRNIPAAVDRVVRHCLEKNPGERFQSAHDLAFHLETASPDSEASAALTVPAQRQKRIRSLGWVIACLVILAAGGAGWWYRGKLQPDR